MVVVTASPFRSPACSLCSKLPDTSSMLISLLLRESSVVPKARKVLDDTALFVEDETLSSRSQGGKNWLIPHDLAFVRGEVSSLYPCRITGNIGRIPFEFIYVESIIFTNAKP